MEDTKALIRVANYAKKIGKSRTWVDKLIKMGELKCVVIDGVKFVRV